MTNLTRARLHRGGGLLIAVMAVFALALFATGGAALAAVPKFPALTGRVVDEAHMLSPETAQKLDAELASLEAQTGHQLVVATVPDLQGHEIEDYGYQLGRAWQLGKKGVNDGAILLVAPSEHKVRIEVGYGLEPVLTDALTSVILQTKVLPQFKQGHMEQGVLDGAEALIGQLGLPEDQAKAKVAEAAAHPFTASHKGGGVQPHIPVILILVIVFWVITGLMRAASWRRHGAGGGWWWLPLLLLNSGRGGGWGGGGGGGWGGGGGGGGFSGGGGSFGGGGSSGSW